MATRSRRREFSEFRLDHSAKSLTANSRVSKPQQIKQNHHPYERKRNPTASQLNKSSYTIQNQTQQRRDQLEGSHSRLKSTPKWVCVGCYNRDMSEAKQRRNRKQKELQRSRLEKTTIMNQDQAVFRYRKNIQDQQYQKVKQYNLKKIEENRNAQEQKKLKKEQQQREVILQQEQLYYQNEKIKQQNNRQREQLKRNLEDQIEKKRRRIAQQNEEKRQPMPVLLTQKSDYKEKVQKNYRQGLIKQINQNRQRKKKNLEQQCRQRKEYQARIIENETQKILEIQKQHQKRKQIQLEQKRQRRMMEDRRREQQYEAKRRQEQYQYEQIEKNQRDWEKKEAVRRNQIDKYLKDLKKQMQINKKKRQIQYQDLHAVTQTSIYVQKREIPQRQCDSCEKKYPKTQLTKISYPLE